MRSHILFTGGGGAASSSIYAQWSSRYELYFADANCHSFSPSIPKSRRITIPFAHDPNFLKELFKVCDQLKIDIIVPGVDEELIPLAEMHDAPGWPKIILPKRSFVELMLDKKLCAETLITKGLSAPRTKFLNEGPALDFPIIAKPRSGRGSRGVMKLERPEQIDGYLALFGGNPEHYIAQEFISGAEYTVLVCANSIGELKAVIPVLVLEKKGITIRARTHLSTDIINYVKQFQESFRPTGIYNIQCVLTDQGNVLPFEVNPRISTTFALGIATGFDPVSACLEEPGNQSLFVPKECFTLSRSWATHIGTQDSEEQLEC